MARPRNRWFDVETYERALLRVEAVVTLDRKLVREILQSSLRDSTCDP